jgi:hypothetical protein
VRRPIACSSSGGPYRITVKQAVPTQELAEADVDRLNELAAMRSPGVRYFARYTRMWLASRTD